MIFARGPGAPLLLLGLAACAGSAAPPAATPPAADMRVAPGDRDSTLLPPMPVERGRLAIRVIYPAPDAVVRARDSSFLIGSIGTGDAKLTINGNPVRVWPNGAWLAWIPLPADSVMRFRFEARTATDSAFLDYAVRRGGWQPERGAKLVARYHVARAARATRGGRRTSISPSLPARAKGRRSGSVCPTAPASRCWPESRLEEVPEGVRAFDRTPNLATALRRDRYVGVLRGRDLGAVPGGILGRTRPPIPSASARHPGRCTPTGQTRSPTRLLADRRGGLGVGYRPRPLAAPARAARYAAGRRRARR